MDTVGVEKLEQWYLSQCNGDWEHGTGVRIGTLDNPGWSVDISLRETQLEGLQFEPLSLERTNTDWIFCRVINSVFSGRGGPTNLHEILEVFYKFAGLSS